MLSTSPFAEFIRASSHRFSTPGSQTNEIQLNEFASFELQTLNVQQSAPAVLQQSATNGTPSTEAQPTLTPDASLEATAIRHSPAESITPDTADFDQEALVFAEFIHHLLRKDAYVRQRLPSDSTSSQLCAACSNGIIPWSVPLRSHGTRRVRWFAVRSTSCLCVH